MSILTRLFLTLFASVLALSNATASSYDILYFVDGTRDVDRMSQALDALPSSFRVTVAESGDDFATRISTGEYELGVLSRQTDQWGVGQFAHQSLRAFVQQGGKAIVTDFLPGDHTKPWGVSVPGGLGFNYSRMTITNPVLSAGISDPVQLVNPGWGLFANYGMLPFGDGVVAATFTASATAHAIVIGNNGRSIYQSILSDTFAYGADGTRLYTNEIRMLLGVPEPSSVTLLLISCIAACGRKFCNKS